jgi:ribosomal protein L24E
MNAINPNTVKTCSFCGETYTEGEGHNYDQCVRTCEEKVMYLTKQLQEAKKCLREAREIQSQMWWRKKFNDTGEVLSNAAG